MGLLESAARVGMKIGLIFSTSGLLEDPVRLYTNSENFCENTLTAILMTKGYKIVPPKADGPMSLLRVTDGGIETGVENELEHAYQTGVVCKGKRWVKEDRVVCVCDWGLGILVVATNIPHTYNGDYDQHGKRIRYASEDHICSGLYEKGFSPISPLEIVKMYKRKEL